MYGAWHRVRASHCPQGAARGRAALLPGRPHRLPVPKPTPEPKPVGAQRFSQGGLIRCRALERVAEDMLAMAPGQAPGPGAADISARGLRAFFRLDSDGPTVRDGRAYFGSGDGCACFGSGAAPDPARVPDGAAAGACAAAQSADGAVETQPGSAAGSSRPGVAESANGGDSVFGTGHGGMASHGRAAGASENGGGEGGRGLPQGGAPQAAAVAPASAREGGAGGAGGDADVELPIVTPFSHRLQDVLQRVAAAPVRPPWPVETGLAQKQRPCE